MLFHCCSYMLVNQLGMPVCSWVVGQAPLVDNGNVVMPDAKDRCTLVELMLSNTTLPIEVSCEKDDMAFFSHDHVVFMHAIPSLRQSKKTFSGLALVRASIVGEKNMHSSSGCAIIRSTLPVTFREHFPPCLHQSKSTHDSSDNSSVMKKAAA